MMPMTTDVATARYVAQFDGHVWLNLRYLAARPPRQAASKTTARTP